MFVGGVFFLLFVEDDLYKTRLSEDALEDDIVVDLIDIGGLDLNSDTDELLADGILGGSVEHLGLDLGAVGSPDDKEDLVTSTLSLVVVGKVEDGITAVVGGELSGKVVVGSLRTSLLLDNNLSKVVGQTEDDISEGVTKLQGLVSLDNVVSNGDSRSLLLFCFCFRIQKQVDGEDGEYEVLFLCFFLFGVCGKGLCFHLH